MIYVITGLMASGKSTVAELLAKEFPKSVHLHGDVFRKMIVSGRAEMSENPSIEALDQLDLRYRLTANAAKEYHNEGFIVIIQDNYYGEKLPYFLKLLGTNDIKTVVLCPNAETIRLREEKRNKNGYIGFDVAELYDEFMKNTPHIGLWIDSSNLSPEETAATILNAQEIDYEK